METSNIMKQVDTETTSILETVDEFVACVPWGNWRAVTVYRRHHGGREWVRLRTWNQHRDKHVWYPSKRFFVIPLANAEDLADAIRSAATGGSTDKPDWLVQREQAETRRIERLTLPPDAKRRALARVNEA
jgi:hypothetical protein